MASPIDVKLILCDAAQSAPDGKVHMLGAGWSYTGSPTAPMALALLVKVPWDRANQKIKVKFTLVDSDGKPVLVQTPAGPQAIGGQGDLEVGRPVGTAPGSPIDASFSVNIGPLPLQPGRYEWRLDIGEDDHDFASFTVRGPNG